MSIGAFVLVVLPGEEDLADLLVEDIHAHHPDVPLLLVVSDETSRLRDAVPARTLGEGADAIVMGWNGEDLRAALVPYALASASQLGGAGCVALLAPGLRLVGPLPPIGDASLVLVTNPNVALVAADGHDPDVTEAVRLGPFSHGLVLAGPTSLPLLELWKQATAPARWEAAPERPLFAVAAEAAAAAGATVRPGEKVLLDPRWGWDSEQTWPAVVDLRAYRRDEQWVLDPRARSPRTLLSKHPELARFVALHRSRITSAPGGGPTPLAAALARRWMVEQPGTPFESWLAEPVAASPPSIVPVALAGIWKSRPDLRAVMPLGLHHDARVLSRWWLEHGCEEEPFPDNVRAAIEAVAQSEPAVAPEPTPGLTVAGYLGAALGLGRMGRLLVEAARRAELPVSLVENYRTASRAADDRPDDLPVGLLHQTTLLAVTGDQTPGFVHDLPAGWREGRRTIGVWAWELDQLPDSHQAGFAHVDEVWTISTFARDAIASVAPCPVSVVPLPVPVPTPTEGADEPEFRLRLGMPADRDYLLFVMDLLSDLDRKNPLGLIEAHAQAFPEGSGPVLVLKLMNGDRNVADAEQLRLVADRHDVVLVEEVLTAADLDRLMSGALGYVSLHRSEGFGLTLAEAMAHGVPTIATAYGGNLDFMDPEVSLLVPYTLVDTPPGSAYAGGRWADPDLDAAAEAMRRLVDDPLLARDLGLRGQQHIREVCSWERTGAFLFAQAGRTDALLVAAAEALAPPVPSIARRVLRRLSSRNGR